MAAILIGHSDAILSAGLACILRDAGHEVATVAGQHGEPDGETGAADILILDPEWLLAAEPEAQRRWAGHPQLVLMLEGVEPGQLRQLLALDPKGILMRPATAASVRECMQAVAEGSRWFAPALVQQVMNQGAAEHGLDKLTARESDVLRLAERGLRNKEIARHLNLCEGTVKMHLHRIYNKLNVGHRGQLVALRHEPPATPSRIRAG